MVAEIAHQIRPDSVVNINLDIFSDIIYDIVPSVFTDIIYSVFPDMMKNMIPYFNFYVVFSTKFYHFSFVWFSRSSQIG